MNRDRMSGVSLYRQVLGPRFALLPPGVQQFHSLQGEHVLDGWVRVAAPASLASRWLARCLGAPLKAQEGPIRFELAAQPGCETWLRRFPATTMKSRLARAGNHVAERLGLARLGFELEAGTEKLAMRLVHLRFLGVPCPGWLLPAVVAEETASAGRLHFRVCASLPLAGLVTAYEGHLDLPAGAGA